MPDIDVAKIRQLDFTLLLIMQGLLRYGRTTQVARELGLSQPAISHALNRLRYLFDDPLFVRLPHGLAPTHHATSLAPHIEQLLETASVAIGLSTAFRPETSTRNFRIGAPEHLCSLITGPLLQRLEQIAPNAQCTMTVEFGEPAIRSIEQHRIDLAIGQFNRIHGDHRVELLYEDRFVLVTRADHPAADSRMTKRAFETMAQLSVSPTGNPRGFLDEQLEQLAVKRRLVARVPRFQTAFEVVRDSDAGVIAPARLANFYARTFRLQTHALPFKLHPIRVVSIRRDQQDPAVEWLAAQIRGLLVS